MAIGGVAALSRWRCPAKPAQKWPRHKTAGLPKGRTEQKNKNKNDKKYRKRRTKRDVQVVQKLWPKSKPKANSKKYIDGMLWGARQTLAGIWASVWHYLWFVICAKSMQENMLRLFHNFPFSLLEGEQKQKFAEFRAANEHAKKCQNLSAKLKLIRRRYDRT